MSPQKPLHHPVVQLALEGLGAAGRARERAASGLDHWQVAATISRRPEQGSHSLEVALADPQLSAWAISLENTAHAPAVRRALEAGKHVLCDYPLALSATKARDLFQLAQLKKRILHVEHIGLLGAEHLQLKERVQQMGELTHGEYLFQGGFKESLLDESRQGPLPFLSLSRLLQVADLFGTLTLDDYRLDRTPPGFSLHLHLRTPKGGRIDFTEERRPGLPRRRSLAARGTQGQVHWKAGVGGGGLFAKDLEWFRKRIEGTQGCYYDEALMIEMLQILEGIH